jgi:hypothetical protein
MPGVTLRKYPSLSPEANRVSPARSTSRAGSRCLSLRPGAPAVVCLRGRRRPYRAATGSERLEGTKGRPSNSSTAHVCFERVVGGVGRVREGRKGCPGLGRQRWGWLVGPEQRVIRHWGQSKRTSDRAGHPPPNPTFLPCKTTIQGQRLRVPFESAEAPHFDRTRDLPRPIRRGLALEANLDRAGGGRSGRRLAPARFRIAHQEHACGPQIQPEHETVLIEARVRGRNAAQSWWPHRGSGVLRLCRVRFI